MVESENINFIFYETGTVHAHHTHARFKGLIKVVFGCNLDELYLYSIL